jgi:diguanylate cyclase (GGDEF)-like protein/PAS domain S-box-containing protein
MHHGLHDDDWIDVFDALPTAVVVVDVDARILHVNEAGRRAVGGAAGSLLPGADLRDVLGDHPDGPDVRPPLLYALATGIEMRDVEVTVDVGGQRRWWRVDAVPLRHPRPGGAAAVVAVEDVTDRRLQRDRMAAEEERLRTVTDGLPDVAFAAGPGGCTYMNPAWHALTGQDPAGALGFGWCDAVAAEDLRRVIAAWALAMRDGVGGSIDFHVLGPRGERRPVRATVQRGEPGGFIGSLVDRTAEEEQHRRLRHDSTHDPLTGLGNRVLLGEAADRLLAEAPHRSRWPSLIALDLDGFKPVNDLHGHAAGDAVLRIVGRRLAATTRDGDLAVRLGGDEFAVLVRSDDLVVLERIARRVAAEVARPVRLDDGTAVRVGVSLGIAPGGEGVGLDDLVRRADAATYDAKHRGGRSVAVRHPRAA